jgi:hypothetical protein
MPTTITTLHQDEIPEAPPSAVACYYSLTTVAEMTTDFCAALPSKDHYAVGVSIQLAPSGSRIQTLALGLQDQVFCLTFEQKTSAAHRQVLRKLLSNIQYLAGFEIPYTIALLARMLGSNISGYDLTTADIHGKPEGLMTPGVFWNLMDRAVSARRVNERWDGRIQRGNLGSSGTPQPDYALRAWFTAMYRRLLHLRLLSSDIRF